MSNPQDKIKRQETTFKLFLEAYPELAALVHEWNVDGCDQHADINCSMKDGSRVDYQLAEWRDGEQTSKFVRRGRTEKEILTKLLSLYPKSPQNIHSVLLSFHLEIPSLNDRELTQLAEEFGRLIHEVAADLLDHPEWQTTQGYPCNDFKKYLAFGKYISWANFNLPIQSDQWLTFELPGGSYDPADALKTLLRTLQDKVAHYGPVRIPLNLILHYSNAYLDNTPYHGIGTATFEDVAKKISEKPYHTQIAINRNQFGHIFLLNELGTRPEAFCVYPEFDRCT